MTAKSITFSGSLPVLLRSKTKIVASGLITACLALGIARILPQGYTSEGSLIVESRATGDDAGAPGSANGVLTQTDILRSSGLIRRVNNDLKLADAKDLVPSMRLPAAAREYFAGLRESAAKLSESVGGAHPDGARDKVVEYIQKHLRVDAKDSSNVILVQFQAGAPDTASAVVNGIMAAYLATVAGARKDRIAQNDQWIAQQTANYRAEVEAAEQRVRQFVDQHSLPEIQGSSTSAIQLSRNQTELALARADLARQQASYDTIARGGNSIAGAQETIGSRTIQNLKDLEAKTAEKLNALAPADTRRTPLQSSLDGIRAQLKVEHDLIAASIARDLKIARAKVDALEAVTRNDAGVAQKSSTEGSALRQLTGDLDAKRQLFIEFVKRTGQMQIAAEQAPLAHILYPAVPAQLPAYSSSALALLLGLAGGMVGAAGMVLLRDAFGTKINSTSEMALATGLPVLGCLPNLKNLTGQTAPLVAETLRGIWLAIRPPTDARQEGGTTVVVTSSEVGEGKTTVAAAMAYRMASDGFRVLLVDADLRRPRLSSSLHSQPVATSLDPMLAAVPAFASAISIDHESGFHYLLARGVAANPMKVLLSEEFKALLAASRQVYDFVILDSPPVLRVADALLLAKVSQQILFIVKAGSMSGELVSEVVHRFPDEDRAKISTLLTQVRRSDLAKADYYGGYAPLRLT